MSAKGRGQAATPGPNKVMASAPTESIVEQVREEAAQRLADVRLSGQQGNLLDLLAGDDRTAAERFADFHRANPGVYEALVRLAREWRYRTGRDRLGIAVLWERLRWELSITTDESPRLNNDYKPWYARLIMAQEADLADIFEVRRAAADAQLLIGSGAP